jgi:hypothetical protein
MRVNGNIPSLINGVSQQPPSLRLPTQGVEQINAVSSLLDGLGKRPPAEYVARLTTKNYVKPFIHWINRDETEKYVVLFYPEHIQVVDQFGVSYPVVETVDGDLAYIDAGSPYRMIQALTVNDTTFVVNQTRETKLTGDLVLTRAPEAIVWIRAGSYSTTYTIKVDGTAYTLTTDATDPTTIRTQAIADGLTTNLASALGADYSVTRSNNTIWIKRIDDAIFNITTSDSNGDRNHSLIVGQAPHFTDLPEDAPNGAVAKVLGDIDSQSDDYWVQFQTRAGVVFGPGTWVECARPGVHYKFLADTMPHQLVRKQDDENGAVTGTPFAIYFEFGAVEWRDRKAGDGDSIPTPSFIGHPISSVFLHRGRLGFLALGNVVLSQAGDLINFWRQTATTLLDDDPIDTPIAHQSAVNLRHAVPFNGELLLFSDHAQFILKGGDLLTPKTVNTNLATQYSSHIHTTPVNTANTVYFPFDNGSFTGLREYYVDGITQEKKAETISDQCPRYIPGSGLRIAVSTTENMLFLTTDQERESIWVYQWFINGQQKIQSSWSKWTFGDDATVLAVGFLGDVMNIIVARNDGTYLEQLHLDPGLTDTYADYVTHLDRRVNETTEGVGVSYNSTANTTTITTPFLMDGVDDWLVVTRANGDDLWRQGKVLTQVSHTLSQIVVRGDARPGFWLGRAYSMEYEFATPYLRSQSQLGGVSSVEDGRLQVLDFTVKYDRTGYFRAVVVPDQRDAVEYKMTGQSLLVPSLVGSLGEVQIRSGSLRFPILARNTNVRIKVVNDSHLPSYFSGAEWNAIYTTKSTRV